MLIGAKYRYTKVAFENEAEIEKIINDNSELLFGAYAVFLPKSKITTFGGKGTVPDGIAIDLESKEWFVWKGSALEKGQMIFSSFLSNPGAQYLIV